MLAWSEGTDNGRQKPANHGYDDVIVGGELFTDYPTTSQTCHVKPKLKSQAGRYQLLLLVGCHRKQLGLKDFSPKSQDAVVLQQIGGAWRLLYD